MCGIVGALSFKQSHFRISEAFIRQMRDTMPHRGPDGTGVWIHPEGRCGLGHRRLAIIDLSDTALQPMASADGEVQVAFNGEIYNHAELREELKKLGHLDWKTDHSDTEVIIRAYYEWGIDCLDRFRGMFALAIWDGRAKEMWLVRDRLGIKPLYYSIHHGRIVFASEIKALLQDPDQRAEVDEDALFHFLSFMASPGPDTLFAGIRKLPCGRWLRISEDGTIREHRYWDALKNADPQPNITREEAAERVISELRRAVSIRKVGDVPVGVFLSGGLDSSTNAALFAEGDAAAVKTYNVAYEGDPVSYRNEHEYAREVAAFVDAEHHEVFLSSEDALSFLPEMIDFQDEPIADPVCVPLYYVSKLARDDGTIVCQVGEGADELFCGYNQWRYMLKLSRWNDLPFPKFMKKGGLAALDAFGKRLNPARERLRRAADGLPPFWGGAEAFTQPEKELLLSDSMNTKFRGRTSWEMVEPIYRHFTEHAHERSHLNWMSYIDLNLRLPEMLLMRVDKMTMAVSLEGRVPFLDHKLVELVMGLPAKVKYDGGELKPLLKQAVKGIIPDSVIARKKQGFGMPVDEWFNERLAAPARSTILGFCRKTGYFDSARVESWLTGASAKQRWYLLNLALWHERYIEGQRAEAREWLGAAV